MKRLLSALFLLGALALPGSAQISPTATFKVQPKTIIDGQTFTSQVNVSEDGVGYINCVFEAPLDRYCVRIVPGTRYTQFVNCIFRDAMSKGIVAEWTYITNCIFEDLGSDGVFVNTNGHVVVRRSLFRRFGTEEASHADGVQVVTGSVVRILGNRFVLPHLGGAGGRVSNSCIIIKADTQYGPPFASDVVVRNNVLDGGLYSIWVIAGVKGVIPENITVEDNIFGRHYYGPHVVDPRSPLSKTIGEDNDFSHATLYRPSEIADEK